MVARVGINGFGRIGRVIFRTCLQSKDIEITAINDPAIDIEYICYLIKFDSTHGKFKSVVTYSNGEVSIEDKKIKVFSEKLPANIPWHSADVHYVVEASGMFTNLEKASGHLTSESVRRVIVTAPTVDVPMLILGVNKDHIFAEQKVISCASSTLYCLAPIVKILEDNFGVTEGFITSIHAMTPSLKPLDGLCIKGKHWRDHRSIHQNIIPAATGACKALGKIIPSVRDKLTGLAFRVPIVNVSVLDITVRLTKNTTLQDIIKCVEKESQSAMKNIIKISKDQEVSSDFLGDENSCILDVNSSLQLNPNFFKLICWYENEYSYACRVVGSINFYEENRNKLKLMTNNPIDLEQIVSPKTTVTKKPIPDFKKDYVISNCLTQKGQNALFGTSQDNGFQAKSQQRKTAITRHSPLQSSARKTLFGTKQNNETFKVWNDEVKALNPLVKENRNLLFQSCMKFGPSYSQNNNYLKTKERLEEVKKEFSKMVDMTENLLKKSSQNSREINILEEEIEKEIEKVVENKDTKQDFINTCNILPIIGKSNSTSEKFRTNVNKMYKDVFKTHNKENSNIVTVKNTNKLNYTPNIEFKEINQRIEPKCKAKIFDKTLTNCQYDSGSHYIANNNEKDNFTKTNDVNQQNIRFENTTCTRIKSLCTTSVSSNNVKPNFIAYRADLGSLNFSNKLSTQDEIQKLSCPKDEFTKTIESNTNSTELTVTYIKEELSDLENKKLINNNEPRKKIIEGILNILNADSVEDKTPSLVNTNTTISTKEVNRYLDIYDKIDSESATDSDNSFQVNEKTSQIINITDLTSSAEDLARLDKICRIIEISDEMSNKLFSALENDDNKLKQKKWSFKDLCDRLKLDDFCNTVFAPSQS